MFVLTKVPNGKKRCCQMSSEKRRRGNRSQTDLNLRVREGAGQATTTVLVLFLASCGRYVPVT